jgi:hypothetical protein
VSFGRSSRQGYGEGYGCWLRGAGESDGDDSSSGRLTRVSTDPERGVSTRVYSGRTAAQPPTLARRECTAVSFPGWLLLPARGVRLWLVAGLLLVSACGGSTGSSSGRLDVPPASALPSSDSLPSPYENDAAVGFELVLDGKVPKGVSFQVSFTPPGTGRVVTFTFCPQEGRPCTGAGTVYSEGGGFQPKGGQLKYAFVRISELGVQRTIAQGVIVLRESVTLHSRFTD